MRNNAYKGGFKLPFYETKIMKNIFTINIKWLSVGIVNFTNYLIGRANLGLERNS